MPAGMASICARSSSTFLPEASVNSAIEAIIAENGRLDVVVHNAGQVVYGPTEAFTPEQLAELHDTNVLSTQRVNRAALPQLRKQGRACSSGLRRVVREAARYPSWAPMLRQKRRWMRWH